MTPYQLNRLRLLSVQMRRISREMRRNKDFETAWHGRELDNAALVMRQWVDFFAEQYCSQKKRRRK